jgi:hypothetical protein
MKSFLNMRILITANAIFIAVIVVAGVFVVYHAKQTLRSVLTENIDSELKTISDLATLTDRNGADSVVAHIIKDCPNRSHFDTLLGNLAELDQKELLSVQQLFDSCGAFYAERKAIMVSKLERENDVLSKYVEFLTMFGGKNPYFDATTNWRKLADLELKRSMLLSEQVTIQRDIIDLMVTGNGVNSKDVQDLSKKAQNTAHTLSTLNDQIDTLREKLIK